MKTLLFALLFVSAVNAQTPPDTLKGKEFRLRLERTPTGQEPFAIAVENFTAEDNLIASGDAPLLSTFPQIIKNDLEFSLFFNVVDFDSTYKRVFAVTDPTIDDWLKLGARFVLYGKLGFRPNEISAQVRLVETNSRREVLSKRFKTERNFERRLAHTISDAIIEQLTGHKGVSSTQIAFAAQKSKDKEIFICDYDGENSNQRTFDRSLNLSPAFAPDASEIVYTSYKSGNPDLWLFDLSSGKSKSISSRKGVNTGAVWSPDGRKIALTLTIDGNSELYLIEPSGKIASRLTYNEGIDSSPTFSPDGRYIAFTSDRSGTPQIYVADADGLNVTRLTYEGNYNDSPTWSPNPANTVIAYVARSERGDFDICTIPSTGGPRQILTNSGSNENPHWSPDGYHIVFSRRQGGQSDIYTIAYDGTGLRQVTVSGKASNPIWSSKPVQ